MFQHLIFRKHCLAVAFLMLRWFLNVKSPPGFPYSRCWSECWWLMNEKYMGDAILQKTFCTDFLTKKMKKNEGELPQYHVRNSHECCPNVNTNAPP